MNTLYLICFVLGAVLSVLAAFGGLGRLHLGHLHLHGSAGSQAHTQGAMPAFNGFTLPAFLCWFGGAGFLLNRYSPWLAPLILLVSAVAGVAGAAIIYAVLFKMLLARERILTPEDTRMDGVVGHVSDEIRANGGIGEILFTQTGARRGAPARSHAGTAIARGTEVVVIRYSKGVAYVTPLDDLTR